MKSHFALLVLAAIFIAGPLPAAEHTKDALEAIKQNLAEKKAVLVDVREQKEWDRGHLEQAVLLPLSELERAAEDSAVKEKLAKDLPKGRIVYCHCARGVRSLMAGGILEKLGYDVRPLKAGYEELRQAGFPAAKK
jgi:rhodanese-related sulfurtransferase